MYKFSKFNVISEAVKKGCPAATHDLELNVANRQHAIDEHVYGPANPDEPGDYWKRLGDIWGIDEKEASTMTCGNCAAFDVSDQMRQCIADGMAGDEKQADTMATAEKADLGYCNILHFKCAGARSCALWLTGGAIDNKDRTK